MDCKSFVTACRLWETDKAHYVKPTTMAAYSLIIKRHLLPHFKILDDLDEESVQRLVDMKIAEGLSITTVKGIALVLKMIIQFCGKQGWMEKKLIELRYPLRNKKPDPKVLSIEEEKRIVGRLTSKSYPMNLGLLLCLCCGLRIGEVCALKWKDINMDEMVIQIRRTVYRLYRPEQTPRSELNIGLPKTADSFREVPFGKELASRIKEFRVTLRPDSEDLFILSGNDKPLEPQSFRNYFRRVALAAGIKPRNVHSLRHTFATRCVEGKCDFKTLSLLLGHSSVTTTLNLYVHPGLEQKRRCIEGRMRML